jgi:hypothetical protein
LVQRVLPPDAANQPNTLPVAARLRITTDKTPTSQTNFDILIGKNENGYYFSPPLWDK